jgi:NhaP-type Na+/H+ or K+/H+ antiporter
VALFVAPILLDAAYDASLRDLRNNWLPVTGLVAFAVGLTTGAVAVVVHSLLPDMLWAAAITLGAIVAPPDAVAATAVLRPLRPPHRILTILEGESLLNDASSLLIYRLAVGAVAADSFDSATVAPALMLAVAGSLVAGPALGWLTLRGTGELGLYALAAGRIAQEKICYVLVIGKSGCQHGPTTDAGYNELRSHALQTAREALLAMRNSNEIGDDAFHRIEEELDWLEMAGGNRNA